MSLCGNNNPCPDLITGQKCGITYTGARYVPLFADPAQWDNTKAYEPLTIVLNEGNSYTSKTFVPVGIDINNTDFWAQTGNYNAQIESYRKLVEEYITKTNGLITEVDALEWKIVTPDQFEGASDAVKIQAAMDYFNDKSGGCIVLNREYDITGQTLYFKKGINGYNENGFRTKIMFFGLNNSRIVSTSNNLNVMFAGNPRSGDIAFINCTFVGGADTVNYANNVNVFDCSTLIRITTINCTYLYVASVFWGKNSITQSTNMQSIRSDNDLLTHSGSFYTYGLLWDCIIDNCTIEQCDRFVYCDPTITVIPSNQSRTQKLTITNCVYEAITLGGIYITGSGDSIYIDSNYVEDCVQPIYFEGYYNNINIANNRFAGRPLQIPADQDFYVITLKNVTGQTPIFIERNNNNSEGEHTMLLYTESISVNIYGYNRAQTTQLNFKNNYFDLLNIYDNVAMSLPFTITDLNNITRSIKTNIPSSSLPSIQNLPVEAANIQAASFKQDVWNVNNVRAVDQLFICYNTSTSKVERYVRCFMGGVGWSVWKNSVA